MRARGVLGGLATGACPAVGWGAAVGADPAEIGRTMRSEGCGRQLGGGEARCGCCSPLPVNQCVAAGPRSVCEPAVFMPHPNTKNAVNADNVVKLTFA